MDKEDKILILEYVLSELELYEDYICFIIQRGYKFGKLPISNLGKSKGIEVIGFLQENKIIMQVLDLDLFIPELVKPAIKHGGTPKEYAWWGVGHEEQTHKYRYKTVEETLNKLKSDG